MTVLEGNPNAAPKHGKRKPVAAKMAPPPHEIEGEGPGWKDVEPPKASKSKADQKRDGANALALDADDAAKMYADELAKNKAASKAKAKAKPAKPQPADEKPKAKAKAAPKPKPKAKAKPKASKPKAEPKAKALKVEPEAKPEKVKAPRRSKGRRPPPAPVEGKVTKILLRLTARDVIDVDLHRGELTRPGYIHHVMRVGIASKGRRATD